MSDPSPTTIAEQFALFDTEPPILPPFPVIPAGVKERGAVFTRRETVDFILDLAGYTPDKLLHRCKLLEPAFGNGAFLISIVERLLKSYRFHVSNIGDIYDDLFAAITAVEVDAESIAGTSSALVELLVADGTSLAVAETIFGVGPNQHADMTT